MSYLLGIDVGTTRTAAAISRLDGGRPAETEMVNLGDRSIDVPSVLYMGDDGSVVVGEAAERRALTDPDRVVREFKRRVGDPTPVVIAGRSWAPEELSARLVRWVVDRVAAREGGPAERIAVTHPASWGSHKKELFAGALSRAGLTVTFLAEPQAAALHYAAAERVEAGATIAVYDLGGGTFDAAVVRKDAGFGLLGRPEGLERLGGIDFDQVVFDHVMAGMPDAFADLDDTDPAVLAAVSRIRRECTEAKEALSSDTEVSVPVLLPGTQGSVRLHRSEFEQLIAPQIEETVAALRRAVVSAGITPEQLSAILLVGGSSRIPLVAQLVSDQLGRPVAVDADPKNAIAKGAATALAPQQSTGSTGAHPPAGRPSPGVLGTGGAAAVGAAAGAAFRPSGAAAPPPPPRGPGAQAFANNPSPPTDELPTVMARGPVPGGYGGPPPAPPRDAGGYIEPDFEDPRPARRGMPVVLVTAGGVLAALAVVAAVIFWPKDDPASQANTRITPTDIAVPPSVETPTSAPATSAELPVDPVAPRATTQRVVPTQQQNPTHVVVPPPKTTNPPPVTTPPPPVTTPPPPATTTASPPSL